MLPTLFSFFSSTALITYDSILFYILPKKFKRNSYYFILNNSIQYLYYNTQKSDVFFSLKEISIAIIFMQGLPVLGTEFVLYI